ncbi:MAG: AsmA-like C-terminal domain-containing protein [Desulfurivibrionaceae bacterium]
MKKRHLLSALVTGLLLTILIGVPYLVSRDSIRQTLIEQIEKAYNVELEADRLHWDWLPLPHLSIYGAELKYNQALQSSLPQLQVYPDWIRIFIGRIQPRRLVMLRPDFSVKPALFKKRMTELPPLPVTDIRMEGASLQLFTPKTDNFPAVSLGMTHGEVALKHLKGRLYLTVQAMTSCSEEISVKGWYNVLTKNYSASASVEEFHLHKLIRSGTDLFTPLVSEVDMRCSVSGALGSDFEGEFRGNLPAFTLRRNDSRQTDIRFQKTDFDFEKSRESISFKARDINLAKPSLTLDGTVKRLAEKTKPVYRLDLRGRDIDLEGTRRSVLNILGDHKTAELVCDIVQGGKAAEVTYQLEGPASDFKDLKNMRISADVASAEILVPTIDLHLEETKGAILIEDGILSGRGLEARLGNSYGSNASLALGLTSDNDLFQLEVDFDNDISELSDILYNLIDNRQFRREVRKFQGRGRIRAHLSMGDSLKDFQTAVDVKDGSNAVINYERLDWPVIFKKGSIKTANRKVMVNNIAIDTGLHSLSDLSGSITLEKDPRMDIENLSARIDPADLLEYIQRYPKIAEALDPRLESVDGTVNINDSKLTGPFLSPEEWTYLFNLRLKDTEIATPYLEDSLNIEKARIKLEEDQVTIVDTDLIYQQSPFSTKAKLGHELFEKWQGNAVFSGTLNPQLAVWIKNNTELPRFLLPATPCRIDDLRIFRDPGRLKVEGAISRKNEKQETVRLDMSLGKKGPDIERLQGKFITPADEAAFGFEKDPEQEEISLNWQGKLQAETLKTLFADPPLATGTLQGDLQSVFSTGTGKMEAHGSLEIEELQERDYLPGPRVNNLTMKGRGPLINIEDLNISYRGEAAEVNGTINTKGSRPEIDLLLSSAFLSQENIAGFMEEIKPIQNKISDILPRKNGESDLDATIDFNSGTFLFSGPGDKDGREKPLTLTPLTGTFHLDNHFRGLILQDSGLCGLTLNATIPYQDGEFKLREISGTNPENKSVYFENVLPCLDIKGSMIKGSFTSDFSLIKENNNYTDGGINLHSKDGKILRWGLLAKIFQVVNITEMGNLLERGGFNYDKLTGQTHISNNRLIIDKAELKGQGLDLLARGDIDLQKMSMDITVFLIPFKTIDAILEMIPLVGRLVQGKGGHIVTIPIGVKGSVENPIVTALPPRAVGKGAINFIRDTITFPWDIIPGQAEDEE